MKGEDPEHGWKIGLREVEGQTEGRGRVRGGSEQPRRAEGPYSKKDVSVRVLEPRAAGGGRGRHQRLDSPIVEQYPGPKQGCHRAGLVSQSLFGSFYPAPGSVCSHWLCLTLSNNGGRYQVFQGDDENICRPRFP